MLTNAVFDRRNIILTPWFYFLSVFRVSELLDYSAEELTGQSMYALCHGEDVHNIRRTHEDCKYAPRAR